MTHNRGQGISITNKNVPGQVFILKTSDRKKGMGRLLSQFNLEDYVDKEIALKANFNSADPFPASTHMDNLEALVNALREVGVSDLILAERSGMGNTRRVLEVKGVFRLAEKMDFNVVVLDEEDKEDWRRVGREGTHWQGGFLISRVFLEAERVVQTCCLKTHRFGGHFTMSLKNSVGVVAKVAPGESYDYMGELHGSDYQRFMIAEINKFYDVDLVVMDAMKAFVTMGPERGDIVNPHLLLASRDRVAIDAVGAAILRSYGSTDNIRGGRIFELDQISRAAELGVGVKSASEVSLIPVTEDSQEITDEIEDIFQREG